MNKRRAYEEVEIAHGGSTVTLRPSLRAATILEERFGFPALLRALGEFNLTIISEIIRVSAVKKPHTDAAAFLSGTPGMPLLPLSLSVRAPLSELVSMLIPAVDPKAEPSTGKPLPLSVLYADLFDVATGWLGWTPEQAWDATPTEISRAYQAKIQKLKALHGSSDEKDRTNVDTEALSELLKSNDLDPEFDRAGLHALQGKRKAP